MSFTPIFEVGLWNGGIFMLYHQLLCIVLMGSKGLVKKASPEGRLSSPSLRKGLPGGFNISAREVENILAGHPNLLDAAAVVPDERLGERVCVYVVPREGEKITLGELTSFMTKKSIAAYKIPQRLEIMEEIPKDPGGEILKNILREDIGNKLKSK